MEFKGIHNLACVHKNAKIGNNVTIGPFAVIGANVKLGDNVIVGSNAIVEGNTTIGKNCRIFPHAIVGTVPQDLKFKNETSYIEVGENTTIRECVTINPGTAEGETTKIGKNNLIMAYCHIAHNCIVGDQVILANSATLAGHVCVEDYAVLGGFAAVHQFVLIGQHSMVGGCSAVVKDVPPFFMIDGNPARMVGLNSTGLKRRGFTPEERLNLKNAYKILFRQKLAVPTAVAKIEKDLPLTPQIKILLDFIQKSKRGISH